MDDDMNLVLIPGYMLDRDIWSDIEPGLSKIGAVHHADLSKDGSIEGMASRLLDDAPERFVLVGFSMGGYVAREVARRAPDRVIAMVLIATSAQGDNEIQAQRKATVARSLPATEFAGLSRQAILSSLAPGNVDEDVIRRIRAMSERLGATVFHAQSSLVRVGDVDRLSEITCPTLIVAARQDQLRGLDEANELLAGIPRSNLTVVEGSGHMIPLEQPVELLAAMLAWLPGVAIATQESVSATGGSSQRH